MLQCEKGYSIDRILVNIKEDYEMGTNVESPMDDMAKKNQTIF